MEIKWGSKLASVLICSEELWLCCKELCCTARCKVNIQKKVMFLNTNNELSEKKFIKSPFTRASKNKILVNKYN